MSATADLHLPPVRRVQLSPRAGGPLPHLVVRVPNWVGDVVMATPSLQALVDSEAFARVSLVLRAHLAPVLAEGPLEPHLAPLAKGVDEARFLESLGADAILLLPNSCGSAWRAFRAGIPRRIGTALGGRGIWLTDRQRVPRRDGRRLATPTALLYARLAEALGAPVPDLHPRLGFSEATLRRSREVLQAAGLGPEEPYALCTPGAAYGAAKLWPPERYAALLDRLHEERGWRGVVSGGPGEEELMEAVAGAARHPALSLAEAPRDLHLLKPLVAGSQVLLVGDSGPRWFAAAFDRPCVSLMGPNAPELTATSLEHCSVVRLEGLECSPCMRRHCPLGHHRCMRDMDVDFVWKALEERLRQSGSPPLAGARG